MRYLTIDTATKITTLALGENGKLVAENFLHTGKTHSERLIPMLDQLLNASDWKLNELDFIGAVRGPGSFTGIRIGIATAQGIAQVLGIPVIGISTLDTLAWAGRHRTEETVVILDARKNEFYTARYRWFDKRKCTDPPKAINPEKLAAELKELDRTFLFVGDAVPHARAQLEETLGDKALIPDEYVYLPRGAYAACELWAVWNSMDTHDLRETARTHCVVEPFYLRQSEAEVNYEKKRSMV